MKQIYIKKNIREGSFGKVYIIEELETNLIFAAKVLNQENITRSRNDQINIVREINNSAGMNHPSIVKFIGYSKTSFDQTPGYAIISE